MVGKTYSMGSEDRRPAFVAAPRRGGKDVRRENERQELRRIQREVLAIIRERLRSRAESEFDDDGTDE